MSVNILSTLELTAIEKLFCLYGSWLKICHAAHLTGDQSVIINNIRYVIPHLLKRHPRMRSRLHINGYQHTMEVLDYDEEYFKPDLFYTIIENSNQSWETMVEDECHRSPYTDNGTIIFPLFHFIILLNNQNSSSQTSNNNLFHILLISNHCASDGRSGYILMNDFLTLVTSTDLHERKEPVNKQIIPCISKLVPRPYSIFYPLLLLIGRSIFKSELREMHHPRIPVKVNRIETNDSTPDRFKPIKAHFLFTSTSTTLYTRLREKCHSQQVTLHGPILACLLITIDHCFPAKNKSRKYLIPSNIDLDFDLRPRLPNSPLTPSTVGFCVGIGTIKFPSRYSLASTRFWSLAKQCVSLTNKYISSGDLYFLEHLLQDTIKNEQTFNEFTNDFPDGRFTEINLSNIGKYPYSCDYNQGQLRLRGLHVTNSYSLYHTSQVLLVTCAGDGQLDISLTHEMESEQKAKEFLDYYVTLLEKCADLDTNITLQQLLASVEQ